MRRIPPTMGRVEMRRREIAERVMAAKTFDPEALTRELSEARRLLPRLRASDRRVLEARMAESEAVAQDPQHAHRAHKRFREALRLMRTRNERDGGVPETAELGTAED